MLGLLLGRLLGRWRLLCAVYYFVRSVVVNDCYLFF